VVVLDSRLLQSARASEVVEEMNNLEGRAQCVGASGAGSLRVVRDDDAEASETSHHPERVFISHVICGEEGGGEPEVCE